MRYMLVVFTALAGLLLAGCSMDATSPGAMMRPASAVVVVRPADGETGVRLDAAITLTFAAPMDRDVVERDLHLISERAMPGSSCPDSATMTHGDMTHCMADSSMMRHMAAYHATPGSFSWNSAGTVCTFQPDSMMMPVARYMIHMGREMMSMMETMGAGGTMGGHGSGAMSGHMMLHFTTMDTTGGHGGHH